MLAVMASELERSLEILSKQPTPAYFLSYEITEERSWLLASSFGKIVATANGATRVLDIDLRVGTHNLDNTHPTRGRSRRGTGRFGTLRIPVSNPDALRRVLWFETDRKYKDAVERLARVQSEIQVSVDAEDTSADFADAPPERMLEDPVAVTVDMSGWAERLNRYTALFSGESGIMSARASLTVSSVTRWLVNSDGTRLRLAEPRARLAISAAAKAEDGMELPRYESFFAFEPDGLPDDSVVLAATEGMIRDLNALSVAPVADPYTGPAILSGRASGVFFHEILGHRVEGHRQRSEEDAQTFKKMLGEPVLPESFSVVFDPTVTRLAGTDLSGSYRFDNQGVRARRVGVIDGGILKRFLMSRSPIDGFPESNGHGRKQPGFFPVSRQSNLIVEVSDALSGDALKALLISRIKAEGNEYGLLFQDIQGGFTFTGRSTPNAFNVLPIMVYRVYPDGREELVRGVDLIGTPLTTFSKVVAASDEVAVFNGICGAESGGVPVSASSPSILISQVEVQKKAKSQERLPILPPPAVPALPDPDREGVR